MSFEDLGIRLRADGVVETSNGIDLVGLVLDKLGARAAVAAAGVDTVAPAAAGAAAGLEGVAAAGLPLLGVLGGVAAVVGVSALAWYQGSQESLAYERALIMTGNAAGTTAGQLQAMAAEVDQVVGTQAKAAEVLAMLASTGNVTRAQLTIATQAAVAMERSLGVAAEETVKQFSALGQEPVKASARLNEQTHFLTLEVWEQIRALNQHGRTAEAGAVAQEAYAKEGIKRAQEMDTHLGTLQKSWRFVGERAKEAWDFMLGLGREDTTQKQMDAVKNRIAGLEIAGKYLRDGSKEKKENDFQLQFYRDQQAALQETLRLETRLADVQATRAAAVETQVKADLKADKKVAGAAPSDPYASLNAQITQRLILASAEVTAGEKLSEVDRTRLTLMAQVNELEAKGGAAAAGIARQRVDALVRLLTMNEAQRKAAEDQADLDKRFTADRALALQTAEREVQTLEQRRQGLVEETLRLTLSADALAQWRQAQNDATIAAVEARIERISGLPAYADEVVALQKKLAVLREIGSLEVGKASAQQRAKEDQENAQRTKALADSINDGIVNGFREGREPADIFMRELKAQAARTLLKFPVQMVSEAGDALIGNLIGLVGGMFGGGPGVDSASFAGDYQNQMDLGNVPLPGRAGGGRVDAGAAYMVGENGPEVMFMGPRSGTVMSNSDMRSALGAGGGAASSSRTVVFSPVFHIDARTDRGEVLSIMQRGMQAAQADLLDKLDRREV